MGLLPGTSVTTEVDRPHWDDMWAQAPPPLIGPRQSLALHPLVQLDQQIREEES